MLIALFSFQQRVAPRSHPFTEFVRSAGEEGAIADERLEEVMAALRLALRGELRRRGLWNKPPSYLGIYGWESWISRRERPGPPAGGGVRLLGEGALDELLVDCYAFIFVDRLRTLKAQLLVKPNIDGLVFLNIRNFLYERQKEHDPLGFRVFEVVSAAVRKCLAEGTLHWLEGDPRVRNDTVLGFDPAADSLPRQVDLRTWAGRVDDELLPELVTARGERQDEVTARLALRLRELRREGIESLRFKDLLDALKDGVRERWAVILQSDERIETEQGQGTAARAWLDRPGRVYEERERFRALVSCVLEALERLQAPAKTRAYLSTLWQYLRLHCVDPGDEGSAAGLSAADLPGGRRARQGRPSDRTLSELLRIPREQLPQLFATLGRLVERCRAPEIETSAMQLAATGKGAG
jgi:hypothetical protein